MSLRATTGFLGEQRPRTHRRFFVVTVLLPDRVPAFGSISHHSKPLYVVGLIARINEASDVKKHYDLVFHHGDTA
jgi:hypothetical protein